MNIKKITILIFFIVIGIALIGGFIYKHDKYQKRADIKIPILLYHNFVITVPDSDPDNFNYINTPESFCEMTGKEILEEIEK